MTVKLGLVMCLNPCQTVPNHQKTGTVELKLLEQSDGSFTTAVSNSFLSPWEEVPWLQILDNLV